MGDTGYNVLVDLDFSGVIEQDECDAYQNDPYAAALVAGAISDPDFDSGPWSAAGYDGYIYDDIAALSCVRFRWYNAALGRWMTRDPIVFADGMSQYEYASGRTVAVSDATGLSWVLMPSADSRLPNAPTDEVLQPAFGSLAAFPALVTSAVQTYDELNLVLLAVGAANSTVGLWEPGLDVSTGLQFARHWMRGSGRHLRNRDWDIRELYNDVASFRNRVDSAFYTGLTEVEQYLGQGSAFAIREQSWQSGEIGRSESLNWYFAFRGYESIHHFVVAPQLDASGDEMASIAQCGSRTVKRRSASFFSTVFKAYNFDTGNTYNFSMPGIGSVGLNGRFTGLELSTMHGVGIARNYTRVMTS